jgi:hypothetical protein
MKLKLKVSCAFHKNTQLVIQEKPAGHTADTLQFANIQFPLPHLQSVVTITVIHPNGMIEFTGRSFGLLLKTDPPRVSDDDLTRHINQVVYIVNSLHNDIILKTIAVPFSTPPTLLLQVCI